MSEKLKEKTKCPGCGKMFLRLASHVKYCQGTLAPKKEAAVVNPIKVKTYVEPVVVKKEKKSFWARLRARLRNRSHEKPHA
jgi:hypothetical protein